jgi:hypothetical protein
MGSLQTEGNLTPDTKPGAEAPTELKPPQPPSRIISARSLLLGVLLIPINCYWVQLAEIKWMTIDVTVVSLFMNVVFCIFVLTLLNILARRYVPRLAFGQGELLVIYVMLSIATGITGHDMMGNLLPNLTNVFWFDTAVNRWEELHRHIPRWFAPRDEEVLRGLYMGNSSFWTARNMVAWAVPAAVWGSFIFVIILVMLCVNILIRRQWIEKERLSFPIVYLPYHMTRTDGEKSFYANRLLWFGFAIPAVLESLNVLNFWYPTLPYVQIRLYDLGQYIVTRPWDAVGWMPISFYPFAIGIAYFLPADLAFSAWFFYLFRKAEDVATVALGFRDPGAPPALAAVPYIPEQAFGAWVAIFVFVLWGSRRHLAKAWEAAWGGGEGEYREDAPAYRWALLGLAGSLVYLTGFFYMAGASWWVPFIFWGLYFLIAFVITRVRAELGPVAHELNFYRPEAMIVQVGGTANRGAKNLTVLSYMHWFNRGYRNLVMPHQLEAYKLAESAKLDNRRMTWAILLAAGVGIPASFAALLHLYYHEGAATANIQAWYRTNIATVEVFDRLRSWIDNPEPPSFGAISFAGIGVGFATFLTALKARFVWWPFHPIGYGLAFSFAMEYFWFTTFLGWLAKVLIIRYGGIRTFRGAIPFFLGLILGDYVIASIWSLIAIIFQVNTYRIFI